MKVIAVFAALLAVSSAQWVGVGYNGLGYAHGLGYSGLGYNGLGYNGVGYTGLAHTGLAYSAAPVQAIHHAAPAIHHAAAVVPVATKTQYHAQDELGQASFGHSEPTQSHMAVRDAAGGVRGTFSYIGAEGIPFTTNYIADHNGYRVASNALPVAPSVSIVGPVDTPEVQVAKAQHAAAFAEAKARAGRRKRGLVSTPFLHSGIIGAPATFGYGYSTAVAHPHALTYSAVAAAPVTTLAHHGLTYGAVAHPVAAPALAYSSVVAAPAVRPATLTRVVNTPGHAVSYRVD